MPLLQGPKILRAADAFVNVAEVTRITGPRWVLFQTTTRRPQRQFHVARAPQTTAGAQVTVRFSEIVTASGPAITGPSRALFQSLRKALTDELSEG